MYALIAVLCWSTVATAFKITLRILDGDVLTVMFYAIGVTCCCYGFLLIKQHRHLKMPVISRNSILKSISLGSLNPVLYYFILFKGYSLLPGQEAQPLNYLWPIILTWLSILFLGHSKHISHIIALFISIFGVLIITTHGHLTSFHISHAWGAVLCVFSAFIWSFYWLLNLKDKRPVVEKMWMNFTVGFVIVGLIVLIRHHDIRLSREAALGVLWIGFFEMGWTYILWMKALEKTSHAALVSNLVYLAPFLSLVFLRVAAGEDIRMSSFVGLFFIVAGILMQSIWQYRLKRLMTNAGN